MNRDVIIACDFSGREATMAFLDKFAGQERKPFVILFSGETVVDAACRNQTGLAGAFGHVMRRLNDEFGEPPDWFLICKGARTYRFLPTFFKRYVTREFFN